MFIKMWLDNSRFYLYKMIIDLIVNIDYIHVNRIDEKSKKSLNDW